MHNPYSFYKKWIIIVCRCFAEAVILCNHIGCFIYWLSLLLFKKLMHWNWCNIGIQQLLLCIITEIGYCFCCINLVSGKSFEIIENDIKWIMWLHKAKWHLRNKILQILKMNLTHLYYSWKPVFTKSLMVLILVNSPMQLVLMY